MTWLLIAVAFGIALVLGTTAAIAALVALLAVLWVVLTYGASEVFILLAVVTVLVALESQYPFTMSMILAALAGSYVILRDASAGHLEPRQSPTVGAPPPRRRRAAPPQGAGAGSGTSDARAVGGRGPG